MFTNLGNNKYKSYCKDCRSKQIKEWTSRNPKSKKNSSLKFFYGIGIEVWDKIFDSQGGKCAICSSTVNLCLDHNHETKEIRGILCRQCNAGIGLLKDSPEILELAAKYLKDRFKPFQ